MSSEIRNCQNCRKDFTIGADDFVFYEKMQVPSPTFCPECRLIRRLVWRNERALYKRKCDLCGESKILMYAPDSPYKVYCYQCWWSDKWTALDYGRDYDFSKSFFEQFRDLLLAVPRPGIIKQGVSVESEYTNRVTDQRNCYLVLGSVASENCRYGTWLNYSKECVDGYNVQKSERCYECIDCVQCYNVAFSQESNSCADSWFLFNCVNCQNCFGCVNLKNKSYCIFNKQYSEEEYKKIIKQFNLQSALAVEGMRTKFEAFKKQFIVPSLVTHHSTNVSGNWIDDSKNIRRSFGVYNGEEGAYCFNMIKVKDVADFTFWGNPAERVYEAINCGIQVADVQFSNECWNQVVGLRYAMNCHSSHNLFGCVGVRNAEYCILNKQYSKNEYESLTKKIREDMDVMPYVDGRGRTYKYGEFYPIELSPFGYNETIAQEFFPLDRSSALEAKYPWRDVTAKEYKITLEAMTLPDAISDVPDTIVHEIIGCEHGGKCNEQCTTAFRILPEDLTMHRRASIPLPRLCSNCRHFRRMQMRTPLKLWHRSCDCRGSESKNGVYKNTVGVHASHDTTTLCPNEFETSYTPERSDIVYCRQCYEAEVS